MRTNRLLCAALVAVSATLTHWTVFGQSPVLGQSPAIAAPQARNTLPISVAEQFSANPLAEPMPLRLPKQPAASLAPEPLVDDALENGQAATPSIPIPATNVAGQMVQPSPLAPAPLEAPANASAIGAANAPPAGETAVPATPLVSFETPILASPLAAERKKLGIERGPLVAVEIGAGRSIDQGLRLVGSEGTQQLVVTGRFAPNSKGEETFADVTREMVFTVAPAGVVSISASGLVSTVGDGEATIAARHSTGPLAEIRVSVGQFGNDAPINFTHEVVPVFTKLGCNGGGCHGKASGQNGFKLSLMGFEPTEDFEFLTRQSRARRLSVASPERSLLLLKASGATPHGGGARLQVGDAHYNLLRRWIAEGATFGDPNAARLSGIEVYPRTRVLAPHSAQQLVVIARYEDGRTIDVTNVAQFEPNVAEMAEVTPSGLVSVSDQPGDVAVMVRYQSQIAVFQATIPLGAPVENLTPPRNVIDELVFHKLKLLGLPPSDICDDATFLRRVTIDLTGRLPTLAETDAFLADADPSKRDKRIDQLLDSEGYAEYFANKWNSILRNQPENAEEKRGSISFHDWIRDQFSKNLPYDQFVRKIVAATGDIGTNPASIWYREVKDRNQRLEDTAQMFLGSRIQCARCHHHPYDRWSQNDYFSFDAFFAQVETKPSEIEGEQSVFHRRGVASSTNPKNGQVVKPAGLGSAPMNLPDDHDPRQSLVDWMAAPTNPYFAPSLVNRYWKHFFNRGLIEPEDDMRATNPPVNPELLAALSQQFVSSGYDMKELVRTICRSTTYQRSAIPNEWNASDKQNFSRYYPKRLTAESLLDAIDALTGTPTRFEGALRGSSAVQLPDSKYPSYFLDVFGRPAGASACECERSNGATLAQGLHLMNSQTIQEKIGDDRGIAANLAADSARPVGDKVRQLYMAAYSRPPTGEEQAKALQYVSEKSTDDPSAPRAAYEDLVWMLINSKEFLFNH